MKEKIKLCTIKGVKDRGVISFVLTKRIVDRDSEVIEPSGGKFETFKTNPIFAWAHDIYQRPPIGKVIPETIAFDEDEVTADVQFDLNDPFAKMIHNKYEKGFLNAGSIRFRPIAWDREPVLENQKGLTITKWELIEFSAVPVPANPGALAKKELDEWKNEFKDDEVVTAFCENGKCEKTAEGWVDFIKGYEANAQESAEFRAIALDANMLQELNGKIVKVHCVEGEEVKFKEVEKTPSDTIEDGILFLDRYNLTEWSEVARAMNDLFAMEDDYPKYVKEFIFNELSIIYKQFKKEPPEFTKEKQLSQSVDIELTAEDYDDMDLVEEAINNILKEKTAEE